MTNNFNIYFKKENMPHAIMLISSDEQALNEASLCLSKIVMCDGDEKDALICQKIEHCNHADVLIFPQEKNVISVEEMLKIVDESFSLPYESESKVLILNNFEKTTAAVQNKLLKTLEEPTRSVFLIICVKNEMAVLPTIASRCQKIRLPVYKNEQILEAIKDYNLTEEQKQDVVAVCDGSIKRAKEFCEKENFFDMLDFSYKLFSEYKNSSQAIYYAKVLYSYKEDFNLFLYLYSQILTDVLHAKLNMESLVKNKRRLNLLFEVAQSFPKRAIVEITKYLSQLNERILRNCNQNIIVDNFLMKILEEKAKWQ